MGPFGRFCPEDALQHSESAFFLGHPVYYVLDADRVEHAPFVNSSAKVDPQMEICSSSILIIAMVLNMLVSSKRLQ